LDHLAHLMAGGHEALLGPARRVAEAQLELNRIRRLRDNILAKALARSRIVSEKHAIAVSSNTKRGRTAKPKPDSGRQNAIKGRAKPVLSTDRSNELYEAAGILAASKELAALSRYERRALSRRKFAIRDLDAARLA
jgi:hypothetical protein